MLTIRSFFTLLLSLMICVTWYSCSDDVCISSYKYEIDTQYSLTSPTVGVNQAINVKVLFPNRIFENDGVDFDNVSKYNFKAALYIRSLSDTTANIDDQQNAIENFVITPIDASPIDNASAVNNSIDLTQSRAFQAAYFVDTMRAININLQTAVKDTYILYWAQANTDEERINRGAITADTCTNVVNFTMQNTSESFDTILNANTLTDFQRNARLSAPITFIVD